MAVNRDKFWSVPLTNTVKLFTLLTLALSSVASAENIQATAEKLLLQKKRMEAINLLWADGKPKKDNAENRRLADKIATTFLNDRSQSAYEEVLSQKREDLSGALDRLNSVLANEPDNLLLLLEKARIQIRKNECELATETLLPYTKINFGDEDLQILIYSIQVCRNPKGLGMVHAENRPKHPSPGWFLVDLEHEEQLKDAEEMKASLQDLDAAKFNSPQIYYWRWKLAKIGKKQDVEDGKKYVQLCKNLSSTEFREYFRDPHLCQYVGDIDEGNN